MRHRVNMSNKPFNHNSIGSGKYGIGKGPANIGLTRLNSIYHHWCNDELEEMKKDDRS